MPHRPPHPCTWPGCPQLVPPGTPRCPRHTPRQPTAAARGYGTNHQRARAALAPFVAQGTERCTRCGQLIRPGEPWELDHRDDGKGYAGPAHTLCNRQAGGQLGAARRWRPTR